MAHPARSRQSEPPIDGLSVEEAAEFEMLDALPPLDVDGDPAWTFEGKPTNDREKRWLELYRKQLGPNPTGFRAILSRYLRK
jgi:hypothetical protein